MHEIDNRKEFQKAVMDYCLTAANLHYYLQMFRPVDHAKVLEVLKALDDMLDELNEQAYGEKPKD